MAAIFSKVSEQYGELVNFIIRPPRDNYTDEELGPPLFTMGGRQYKRTVSALPVLLPQNITVFAFDFSGSGRSDGPYISLGWWERDDLDTVIDI
ncbi:uncharacterized protein EMH_0084510 [Eimeria mitis]|uniref:Serine aminopeptidase S33 domain-containing protein n=1 Tax=Eimeria mitis TaxID=44415 RepID=U6KA23_9EIME|nr:uncharacterized protein EMH_0084510 [Eimeria mitis]CDJ33666.1 hypothetical protein, conserved [Eimeria mitis]